jgi:hypothetical protein
MSTPIPPLVPLPDDGDPHDSIPRQEVDGERVLDADADPDQIDSAAADRIAAENGDADQDDT